MKHPTFLAERDAQGRTDTTDEGSESAWEIMIDHAAHNFLFSKFLLFMTILAVTGLMTLGETSGASCRHRDACRVEEGSESARDPGNNETMQHSLSF
jgi:hypothetical protein